MTCRYEICIMPILAAEFTESMVISTGRFSSYNPKTRPGDDR